MAEEKTQQGGIQLNELQSAGFEIEPMEDIRAEPAPQATEQNEPTNSVDDKTQEATSQDTDWFPMFNKEFETTYESKDDIKTVFESAKKVSVYEKELENLRGQKDYFDQMNKIISDMEDQTDVVKQFGSEDNYKAWAQIQQLKGKNIDEATAMSIITKVNDSNNMEAALLQMKVDHPGVADSKLEKRLLREAYKIAGEDFEDFDPNNIPQSVQDEISFIGAKAKKDLQSMIEPVELPERKSFKDIYDNENKQKQEKYDTLVSEWERESKSADIPGIKITEKNENGEDVDVFSYEYGDFDASKHIQKFGIDRGLEPTTENKEKAARYAKTIFLAENFDNIIREVRKTALNESQEKLDDKVNNNQPISSQESPVDTKNPQDDFNDQLMTLSKLNQGI